MKIRLTGTSDLVAAWAAELPRAYSVTVALYPSRRGGSEVRAYCDLDDRRTAEIVGLPAAGEVAHQAVRPSAGALVDTRSRRQR